MFRAFATLRHGGSFMTNSGTHAAGSSLLGCWFQQRQHRYLNNLSDRELQKSFTGFWPKFSSLIKTLATTKGWREFTNLRDKRIIRGDFGLIAFAQLQNPLLIKYGFDIIDFAIGAKQAYKKHMRALLSAEFRNFAKGHRKSCAAATFLQSSTTEQIYNNYLATLKSGSRSAIVDDIDVFLTYPFYLVTAFIRNDEIPVETPLTDMMHSLQLLPPKEHVMFNYPDDSVVVTVRVFFFSKEYRCMRCEFEGCISGHVPLDWKIKSLRESKLPE